MSLFNSTTVKADLGTTNTLLSELVHHLSILSRYAVLAAAEEFNQDISRPLDDRAQAAIDRLWSLGTKRSHGSAEPVTYANQSQLAEQQIDDALTGRRPYDNTFGRGLADDLEDDPILDPGAGYDHPAEELEEGEDLEAFIARVEMLRADGGDGGREPAGE